MRPQRPQPGERRAPAQGGARSAGGPPADASRAGPPRDAAGAGPPRDAASAGPFLERYVRELKEAGAIRSAAVERAFRAVERHRLLETFYYRAAGSDRAAVITHNPGRPLAEHLEIIYADNALATRQQGDGWAAASPAGIWWWKDPSLADDLESLYRHWRGHGRPGLGNYQLSFAPVGDGEGPPPGGWRIERRFFCETIRLAT